VDKDIVAAIEVQFSNQMKSTICDLDEKNTRLMRRVKREGAIQVLWVQLQTQSCNRKARAFLQWAQLSFSRAGEDQYQLETSKRLMAEERAEDISQAAINAHRKLRFTSGASILRGLVQGFMRNSLQRTWRLWHSLWQHTNTMRQVEEVMEERDTVVREALQQLQHENGILTAELEASEKRHSETRAPMHSASVSCSSMRSTMHSTLSTTNSSSPMMPTRGRPIPKHRKKSHQPPASNGPSLPSIIPPTSTAPPAEEKLVHLQIPDKCEYLIQEAPVDLSISPRRRRNAASVSTLGSPLTPGVA